MQAGPGLLVGWLLAHFAIGLAGTWLALRYALRRGLLDQPGERRSHRVATPRGGGISIVAAMLAAIVLLALVAPALRLVLLAGGLGLMLVAGAGWVDDHRPLSPWKRLAVHAVAASLLAGAVLLSGHGAAVAALGFLATMVLVNVWNFMDGIDGLAASQAAIAAASYALLAGGGPAALLALALLAACCGFLPFNAPRARIFLGDVGSGALGHALALLLVMLIAMPDVQAAALPLLLLPLAAFLVDATLTLGRRIIAGEQWWKPHVQHAYQVWTRTIGRHAPVTFAYGAWSVAGGALMLAGMTGLERAFIMPALLTAVWCLLAGLAWLLIQIQHRRRKGRTRQP